MTEAATADSSAPDVVHRPPPNSSPRLRRPPEWLWPIAVGVQVVILAVATSYTYFFFDDWLFMQQARASQYDLEYLRLPLFEHFSPVTRTLNDVLLAVDPGNFDVARAVQLALFSVAVAAFAFVVRSILGNSWIALGFTLWFGVSVFLVRLLRWWTATANILPSTIGMLFAIGAYLRWRQGRSQLWLWGSFAGFGIALLDYETAMLFPIYLALISAVALEGRFEPRRWMSSLWQERWAWAGYAVLELVALGNYLDSYYFPAKHPPISDLLRYLGIASFGTFVPALAGIKTPEAGSIGQLWIVVAVCAVAGVTLALTLSMRPRAWRATLAFVVVFLVSLIPVGLNRVVQFGVGFGHEVHYQQSIQFMFLILAAFAVSPRWSGSRAPSRRVARVLAATRRHGLMTASGAAAVVVVYAVLLTLSARGMRDASWEARGTKSFVNTFHASVRDVRAATGRDPVLINRDVPGGVMPAFLAPYGRYDMFFALVEPGLRYDEEAHPDYVVNDTGHLVPVRFLVLARGTLSGKASPCVPPGAGSSRLIYALSRTPRLPPQVNGLPYAVHVRYRTRRRVAVGILIANSQGARSPDNVGHSLGPGGGGVYVRIDGSDPISSVVLDLLPGSCIRSVAVGAFRLAAR